jgi:peroxiredoxin
MRSDIVPGATFPDYELPNHTDTMRKLSELEGDDPLILTLAARAWSSPLRLST